MAWSYKKLWKILIDMDMNQTKFINLVGISGPTLTKLNKGEPVSMDILEKICAFLKCDIGDVVEYIEEK